jgi:V/A-type H+-transporting ATPase subunit K
MKRFVLVLVIFFVASSVMVFSQTSSAEAGEATSNMAAWRYIAAALAVGLSCIAGGIAVGQIGAAAMGAMSENPELSGKALPYMGLAEGICLWGFLVALLILVIN